MGLHPLKQSIANKILQNVYNKYESLVFLCYICFKLIKYILLIQK